MIKRINKAIANKDKGFTLIELLVVVIIIGILAAIAIPLYMNQKAKGYDATVKSDLKNFATQMETAVTDGGAYPTAVPSPAWPVSKGNDIDVYVQSTGATAGYVIIGKNTNSSEYYVLSSYNGSSPTKAGAADPGAPTLDQYGTHPALATTWSLTAP